MLNEYVEQRNGGYYIRGTRVGIDSIVYGFLNGERADEIAEAFEAVTLEQVYGAIAYYLANRTMIDKYLEQEEAEFEEMRQACRRRDPAFYAKLDAARESLAKPRA